VDINICKDTGNEEISLGDGTIDNSIRLIYRVRGENVAVVANTKVGYVSADLGHTVISCTPPWSSGRILAAPSLRLSLNDADYLDAVSFLEKHGVSVVIEDENGSINE
jgi:hypothetical protein